MKNTFYFSHDYNARNDIKIKKLIAKHGYLGYGIFWAIIEDYTKTTMSWNWIMSYYRMIYERTLKLLNQ